MGSCRRGGKWGRRVAGIGECLGLAQLDATCHVLEDLINDDDGEGNEENKLPLR